MKKEWERQQARVELGRLLNRALARGKREAQDAARASKAPYLPSNPALLRELKRCLQAAKEAK